MFLAVRKFQLARFLLQGECRRRIHFIPGDQVYNHLESRGIVVRQEERWVQQAVKQTEEIFKSHSALLQHLKNGESNKCKSLYLGIDPTASSLHVGHLLPLMVLLHFHVAGHRVLPLVSLIDFKVVYVQCKSRLEVLLLLLETLQDDKRLVIRRILTKCTPTPTNCPSSSFVSSRMRHSMSREEAKILLIIQRRPYTIMQIGIKRWNW